MQNVPNTVQNGSGRKAKLSDDELTSIVLTLAQQDGELPTLTSIIEAAGGCQRSRAVAARKAARMALANDDLESHVRLPPEIEVRYRGLLKEWISLSRKQLQPVLDSIVEMADEQVANAELGAQDARNRVELLEQRIADVSAELLEAQSLVHELRQTVSELTTSETHWKALASERADVIRRLTEWPDKPNDSA